MKVGLSLCASVTVLVATATLMSCQTYDFEPVEPLAIAQTTKKETVYSLKARPNIMLLVDKSGSMNDATANGTRLSEMKQAMAEFLTGYGSTARLGLAAFPDTRTVTGCNDACTTGRVLQNIVQSNDVDAELQTAAATINDIIQSIEDPNNNPQAAHFARGGTPTAKSLLVVGALNELADSTRDNFVLLLTDGLPGCSDPVNPAPDTCTCLPAATCSATFPCNCLDSTGVLSAIDVLKAKNIRTIVVGFGAETGGSGAAPLLNSMAERGGFPRACETQADCGGTDTCDNNLCSTRFYKAANAQELALALAKIGKLVKTDPCVFKLTAAPSSPDFLAVYIDGTKVASGPETWNYTTNDGPIVTLTGQLCTRVLTATEATAVDVEIRIVEAL